MAKFVDLFCGIGSFHYSLKKLGFACVMACDINEHAKRTYHANYGIMPLGDITDIEPESIPAFDILCSGLPCQSFSKIGKHKGFDDERGTMFFQILKFVKYHKPKVIILENVPALVTHNKGETLKTMRDILEKQEYKIVHRVFKCDEHGIPQMRKRLFIVCIRQDIVQSIGIDISKFLDIPKQQTPTLSVYLDKNFEKKTAYTIRCGGRNSAINDKHNWDGYIVNEKEYRLSVEDCLKLQGFNDFNLVGCTTQKYKMLGNTIPTNLTYLIGAKIKETFIF
jgi:DNA (cytosine-5)-methyltransferase 1